MPSQPDVLAYANQNRIIVNRHSIWNPPNGTDCSNCHLFIRFVTLFARVSRVASVCVARCKITVVSVVRPIGWHSPPWIQARGLEPTWAGGRP